MSTLLANHWPPLAVAILFAPWLVIAVLFYLWGRSGGREPSSK
jgi:hypothetical protein